MVNTFRSDGILGFTRGMSASYIGRFHRGRGYRVIKFSIDSGLEHGLSFSNFQALL